MKRGRLLSRLMFECEGALGVSRLFVIPRWSQPLASYLGILEIKLLMNILRPWRTSGSIMLKKWQVELCAKFLLFNTWETSSEKLKQDRLCYWAAIGQRFCHVPDSVPGPDYGLWAVSASHSSIATLSKERLFEPLWFYSSYLLWIVSFLCLSQGLVSEAERQCLWIQ